jgi:hypothetical protein
MNGPPASTMNRGSGTSSGFSRTAAFPNIKVNGVGGLLTYLSLTHLGSSES